MLAGLDLGTTNVKALLTDDQGRPAARASRHIALAHGPGGAVEQDLEEIWSAALAVLSSVARAAHGEGIRALGVSSQGGAMQAFTADHAPVGPVLSWLDGRGEEEDLRLTRELGRDWFSRRVGHDQGGMAIGQLLRLARQTPAALLPPHRFGFVGDAIVRRLCGRAVHDGTSAALTLLYNPALRDYDPELLARLGVQRAQLPDLSSPVRAAGRLLPEVARQTGLPPGIPVSPAIHDQYTAALACGAVEPGEVMLGTGTAWVLLAVLERGAEPLVEGAFACHHVVEGRYGQILSLRNGGSSFTWALDLLGLSRQPAAEIEALLSSVHPGSDGLLFVPLLAPGVPAGAAPGARGAWTGLKLGLGPAHLLRALVEGLACELARHLRLLEAAGARPSRLILCGGAAGGETTPQIVADVAGLPLVCLPDAEGSTLGAAQVACALLEPAVPLGELSKRWAPAGHTVHPGPGAPAAQHLFRRYLEAFPARGQAPRAAG